ncbi:MAG TPA: hypothetical protein DD379_18225 [Cyanobacteria bacterium UBA11162]|nr:hypothetical protein [Cyanobacteria bacterium UBA11162]
MNQRVAAVRESLSAESDRKVLCFYTNTTNQLQNLRLIKMPNTSWQRVVFPGERLMFEAITESNLEVYLNETVAAVIPCSKLQVK